MLRNESVVNTRRDGKRICYSVTDPQVMRVLECCTEPVARRNACTPYAALAGGVLIGVAAALLILLNGRTAGVSGVPGGPLGPVRGDVSRRVSFVAGLVGAPTAYALLASIPQPQIDASWTALVFAGLLVGAGTRYGAGCTSGHGVCGLSRLSPRWLVATVAFMLAGFATVIVMRHVLGV